MARLVAPFAAALRLFVTHRFDDAATVLLGLVPTSAWSAGAPPGGASSRIRRSRQCFERVTASRPVNLNGRCKVIHPRIVHRKENSRQHFNLINDDVDVAAHGSCHPQVP